MSEALKVVLFYLFEDRKISVVHGGVFKENAASLNVLTKIGFKITGEGERICRARSNIQLDEFQLQLTRDDFFSAEQPKHTTMSLYDVS